jgi:hypothetical protein
MDILPTYVRLEKIETINANPTIGDQYWVEGELLTDVFAPGQPVRIFRHKNPQGAKPGMFWTSPLVSVDVIAGGRNYDQVEFTTQNSRYRLTRLKQYEVPEVIKEYFAR